MTTYDIWVHQHLREFAVRIENRRITRVCLLSLDCASDPDGRLRDLEYDRSLAALDRFVEHPEQFCQFEPWVQEERVPVRPLNHQAKEQLRDSRRGDPLAVAEWRPHHPERVEPGDARLADAQLVLARRYRA